MTLPRGRSGFNRAALACLCALPLLAAPGRDGARAQEAAFAVQDITLRDVVLDLSGTRLAAPVLTASGTGLSKEALLAILSADGKEPWSVRLAELDAGSLAIPELRVERSLGEAKQTVVYRDVVARGVHAGRIAELTAAGAALTVAAPSGDTASSGVGSYGRIRAEDLDLAALARLATEPSDSKNSDGKNSDGKSSDGKRPWQRLVAAFSVADIVFTNTQGTRVSLDRLAGRDVSGRQVPATWNGAIDILKTLDLDSDDPAVRAKVAGTGADMLDAIAVGSLEATSLRVRDTTPGKDGNGKDGNGNSAEPADITVGRLAYAATGPDAGLSLSEIGFSGAGARMSLARLGLTGFSPQPTIASLRRMAADAVKAPAGGGPSQTELRRLTPVIGTLTLAGFSLDLKTEDEDKAPAAPGGSKPAKPVPPGDPLANPAPHARAGGTLHVALREAAMTFGPPQDGVPTASRISLGGLSLPASVVSGVPGLGALGDYGYRDLDLDLVVDSAWNEASKEVALREVSLKGKDMGSLQLSGTIGGIGADVFDPDAAISGLAMLSATAKALSLRVENGGLYERFIDATAKTLSLKPDELRKEYVTACVIGIPVILGNSPAAKAIGAAMGKFAAKPGTLSISAKAKNGTGLGVVDFSTNPSPGAVLDKLDVTAKAE